MHHNPIHLKYTYIAELLDFVGVQQLNSSCVFLQGRLRLSITFKRCLMFCLRLAPYL